MESSEWQGRVGDSWAAEWQRTDRSLSALQACLIDRIEALASDARMIVDIGCGAGATSIALSERFPQASILGLDISQALLDVAQTRAHPPNCRFQLADASSWRPEDRAPDLLVSRHGVMFFEDPVAAFGHLSAVAAPRARLIFSCFRDVQLNAWAADILALFPALPLADPKAPGPFAFSDPDYVHKILNQAGWVNVSAEPIDFAYLAGGGANPIEDALDYFCRIGPAARALRDLEPDGRAQVIDKLATLLRNHLEGGTVKLKAAAWIWSATGQPGKDS